MFCLHRLDSHAAKSRRDEGYGSVLGELVAFGIFLIPILMLSAR